jgi:hypothetical protein
LRFELKRLSAMPAHNAIQLRFMRPNGGRPRQHQGMGFRTKPFSVEAHKQHETVLRQSKGELAACMGTLNRLRRHFDFLRAQRRRQSGCGTLNDTELQKNFRRKNTARKSFLGHARALNDLPIEAATARPTQRFAAHGGSFVCP